MDLSRRALFKGRVKPANKLVRPPWLLSESLLLDQCSQCGDCLRACPEVIIKLDADKLPQIDFSQGECTFCGECAKACSEPLFRDIDTEPWLNKALINNHCLTEQAVICQSCKDSCPTDAINLIFAVGKVPKPIVDYEACTGCGACIAPCPQQAITILTNEISSTPLSASISTNHYNKEMRNV